MSLFVCHLAGKGSGLREKGGFVQNLQDLQTVDTHGVAWRILALWFASIVSFWKVPPNSCRPAAQRLFCLNS